jgi:hypothetical protein
MLTEERMNMQIVDLNNVTLSWTSLSIQGPISYKRAVAICDKLELIESVHQWAFGDLFIACQREMGEAWSQVIPDSLHPETARAYLWVAEKFPPSVRRRTVKWSTCKELAGIGDEGERFKMLERVEKEGLSKRDVRKELSTRKDSPPKMITCPSCGKEFDPKEKD